MSLQQPTNETNPEEPCKKTCVDFGDTAARAKAMGKSVGELIDELLLHDTMNRVYAVKHLRTEEELIREELIKRIDKILYSSKPPVFRNHIYGANHVFSCNTPANISESTNTDPSEVYPNHLKIGNSSRFAYDTEVDCSLMDLPDCEEDEMALKINKSSINLLGRNQRLGAFLESETTPFIQTGIRPTEMEILAFGPPKGTFDNVKFPNIAEALKRSSEQLEKSDAFKTLNRVFYTNNPCITIACLDHLDIINGMCDFDGNTTRLALTKKEAGLLAAYIKDIHKHQTRGGYNRVFGNNSGVKKILGRYGVLDIAERRQLGDDWELTIVKKGADDRKAPVKHEVSIPKRRPNGTIIPVVDMLNSALRQV